MRLIDDSREVLFFGQGGRGRQTSTSLTRGRLQTFTAPLSALPGCSNRKQRRT